MTVTPPFVTVVTAGGRRDRARLTSTLPTPGRGKDQRPEGQKSCLWPSEDARPAQREQAAAPVLLAGFQAVCSVSGSDDRSSASGCRKPSRMAWKNGSTAGASVRRLAAVV